LAYANNDLYLEQADSRSQPAREENCAIDKDKNDRKTSQPFSTFTFEYEYENESGKAGHENEYELTEYREF
jgi:hypothetical protein